MNLSTKNKCCAILTYHGCGDSRVNEFLKIIGGEVRVFLFCGESGERVFELNRSACENEGHREISDQKSVFEQVGFWLVHSGDMEHWQKLLGPVGQQRVAKLFLFNGDGFPDVTSFEGALPLLRRTNPFSVSREDLTAIEEFVFCGGAVPACCVRALPVCLVIGLLCDCYQMGSQSVLDLGTRGIRNPRVVKRNAEVFMDIHLWKDVLGSNIRSRLRDEGIQNSTPKILELADALDSISVQPTQEDKMVRDQNKIYLLDEQKVIAIQGEIKKALG